MGRCQRLRSWRTRSGAQQSCPSQRVSQDHSGRGEPSRDPTVSHHGSPYSESTFGAQHGKGSQTGRVPDTTPSGWQENICSVSPTPSTEPGAHLAVPLVACPQLRVAAIIRNAREILYKRLSLDSHKKICGKCRSRLLTCWSNPPWSLV